MHFRLIFKRMVITCQSVFVMMAVGLLFLTVAPATATEIIVSVQNLAPANGNFLTPVFVGFHNGGYDIFDVGAPASPGLESLAEDGLTNRITGEFSGRGAGLVQGTIFGSADSMGHIAPGEITSKTFTLEGNLPSSRFFSYAAMVIPSNDAFIANENPLARQIFAANGDFLGASFVVPGSGVWDAGTEVNDEVRMNTAFFGQTIPNTGVSQNGVVGVHPGFLPRGSGGILDDPRFANADFKQAGYQIARITVAPVPEPGSMILLGSGLLGLLGYRYRRKHHLQAD